MFTNRWTKSLPAVVILSLAFLAVGCKKAPSGKYSDDSGVMSIDFASGKATVTVMGESKTGDYTIEGDKVTIKLAGTNAADAPALTYDEKNDALNGPMGMSLKKKK